MEVGSVKIGNKEMGIPLRPVWVSLKYLPTKSRYASRAILLPRAQRKGTFRLKLRQPKISLNAIFQAQPVKQVSKIIPAAVIYDQNIWKTAAQQAVNYQQ